MPSAIGDRQIFPRQTIKYFFILRRLKIVD